MNKPRYIGQTILDISKIVMYQFHYDFMMIRYPDSKLLFTDTDSLCYLIPTDGLHNLFYLHKHRFTLMKSSDKISY